MLVLGRIGFTLVPTLHNHSGTLFPRSGTKKKSHYQKIFIVAEIITSKI